MNKEEVIGNIEKYIRKYPNNVNLNGYWDSFKECSAFPIMQSYFLDLLIKEVIEINRKLDEKIIIAVRIHNNKIEVNSNREIKKVVMRKKVKNVIWEKDSLEGRQTGGTI